MAGRGREIAKVAGIDRTNLGTVRASAGGGGLKTQPGGQLNVIGDISAGDVL